MKNSNQFESQLWQVLQKNRLVDLSQFHRTDFFEEVPLYSRYSDIAFLSDYDAGEASAILLRFALKYLRSVISYEEHAAPFFAAITVTDVSPGDPLVPSLFVWSRPLGELYERLALSEATSPLGKKVKRLVTQFELPDRHEVFEDRLTSPETPRVFVAPALPPYHGFVPIYMFVADRGSGSKRRKSTKREVTVE